MGDVVECSLVVCGATWPGMKDLLCKASKVSSTNFSASTSRGGISNQVRWDGPILDLIVRTILQKVLEVGNCT